MTTFFFTGLTGALGSVLARQLLGRGFSLVCLVRGQDRADAERRARAVLGDVPRVRVVCGDICRPRCGLDDQVYEELRGTVGGVVHCAASISFVDEVAAQSVNIGGLVNVLQLAQQLRVTELHHVSTSYVAGSAPHLAECDCYIEQRWRNPYERSKFCGEQLLAGWERLNPECQVWVYRPSILIGNEDGSTRFFDGYYRYFEPLCRVVLALRARLRESGSVLGVELTSDGRVHLPIALWASQTVRLNLIHVDWAAETMAKLIAAHPAQRCFHVTHPEPPINRDVLSWGLKLLGVVGTNTVDGDEMKGRLIATQAPLVSRIQRQVDAVHQHFKPYLLSHPEFSCEQTRAALGAAYRAPLAMDETALGRALEYAIRTQWSVVQPRTNRVAACAAT